MGGYVYVMEQRDFDNWLAGSVSNQTPVEMGKELFDTKLGCASCHAGGANQRGAKLEGVFGTDVRLTNGQTVKADEEYIRNSILNPQSQIVEGYQPIMPTFKGQVTEEQLNALVAYIKSLSGTTPAAPTGGTGSQRTMQNSGGNATSPGTGTVAPSADRGQANRQGSNPNAPQNNPEPTNRRNQ
jgi:cytochrome c oxidase subunit 2